MSVGGRMEKRVGVGGRVEKASVIVSVFSSFACGHAAGSPGVCAGAAGGVCRQPAGHQFEVSGLHDYLMMIM